jgi:hypothetical protein
MSKLHISHAKLWKLQDNVKEENDPSAAVYSNATAACRVPQPP